MCLAKIIVNKANIQGFINILMVFIKQKQAKTKKEKNASNK